MGVMQEKLPVTQTGCQWALFWLVLRIFLKCELLEIVY